ncbi:MAG: hypothetical protein OXF29_00815, partial [Hyphomicrobiales bacterium]|nr:hypothetical protein [Hyphomicrobiales bacterium]
MDKTTNKETFIRGGRLRKTSKGLISFAPFLAGASALALGALLTTTSPVEAGSCATAGQPAGTARCGDGADDSDSTEELEAPENSSFTVTDADNFGLNVQSANMKGIVITTKATTTDLTVDLDGNVGATDNALEIDMDGTGATTVTMDGALTSSGGDALYVNVGAAATGGVMITANGAVMAQTEGISIRKDNDSGTMSVMTGEDGDITSTAAEGIDITYLGGGVTLDIDGSITSYDDGILLSHSGGSGNAGGAISVTTGENSVITSIGDGQAGSINKNMKEDSRSGGHAINLGETGETSTDVTVVVNGDLGMNTDTGRIYYHGIRLIHEGTGDVNVTINGDVFGGYNTRVLNMTTRSTTDAMTLTLNGNVNTLDGRAVRGFGGTHSGRGLLDITIGSGATVTGFGNVLGSGTDGGTRITVDGTINLSASADGNTVRAAVYSRPTSNRVETEIDINNTVSGQQGVRMTNAGSATMNLDISSTVTGTNGNAVLLGNGGGATGGHVVTLEQGGALNGGIRSVNTGGGALTSGVVQLDINGMITVTSGDAIELGGTSAHTITLREQASVMGTIDVSAAAGGTTLDISGAVSPTSGNALEFGGAGSHTVILREGANIQGRIEKISGATGNVEFRIEGDISENPLVWVDTFDEASRPGRNTFLGFGPSDSILI